MQKKSAIVLAVTLLMLVNLVTAQDIEDKGFRIEAPYIVYCTECRIPVNVTNNNNFTAEIDVGTRFKNTAKYQISSLKTAKIDKESKSVKNFGKKSSLIESQGKTDKFTGISIGSGETMELMLEIKADKGQVLKYDIEIDTSLGKVVLDPYIDTTYILEQDDFSDGVIDTAIWANNYTVGTRPATWSEAGDKLFWGRNETSLSATQTETVYHKEYWSQEDGVIDITFDYDCFSDADSALNDARGILYIYSTGSTNYSEYLCFDQDGNVSTSVRILIDYSLLTLNVWNSTHTLIDDQAILSGDNFTWGITNQIDQPGGTFSTMYSWISDYESKQIESTYTPEPVSYFPLNSVFDTNQTLNQIIYNSNPTPNGTVEGDYSVVSAIYGNGFLFNGSGDVLIGEDTDFSTVCDGQGCAFEAFINTTNNTETPQDIIARYDATGDNRFFRLAQRDTDYVFSVYQDGTTTALCSVDSTTSPVIGDYVHIVGTYDEEDGECRLYVNGVLEDTTEIDLNFTGWTDNEDTYLARKEDGDYFRGTIDYARIFDRSVSGSEAMEMYESGENYSAKYLNLTILDERTNSPVTDSLSITLTNEDGTFAQDGTTESGYWNSNVFPAGNYTLRVIGDNYPARVFDFEATTSTVSKTVYMLNTTYSQSVKFNVRDSDTNVVRDALVAIYKTTVINDTLYTIPVTIKYTDYLGTISTVLDIDTIYDVVISKEGFRTINDTQEVYSDYDYTYILFGEAVNVLPYLSNIYNIFTPDNQSVYAEYLIVNGTNTLNNTFSYTAYSSEGVLEYNYIRYHTSFDNDSGAYYPTSSIEIDLYPYINNTVIIEYGLKRSDKDYVYGFNRTYIVLDSYNASSTSLARIYELLKPDLTSGERLGVAIIFALLVVVAFGSVGVPVAFLPIPYIMALSFFAVVGWIGWTFFTVWVIVILLGYVISAGVSR